LLQQFVLRVDSFAFGVNVVFTTNKPIELWGEVLHDPDLAEAILDRILERGRLPGMPQKTSPQTARISGKSPPECPERTVRGWYCFGMQPAGRAAFGR